MCLCHGLLEGNGSFIHCTDIQCYNHLIIGDIDPSLNLDECDVDTGEYRIHSYWADTILQILHHCQ